MAPTTDKKKADATTAADSAGTAVAAPSSPFLDWAVKNPMIINTCNAAEIKHTVDDCLKRIPKIAYILARKVALPILIDDFKFDEDHTHIDRKLLMGYGACFFAAYASLYSYFVPFPHCKSVLLVSVVAYFILNGAMLLYAFYVEKDVVFTGVKKDPLGLDPDQTLVVSTVGNRFSSEYTIRMTLTIPDRTQNSGKGKKTPSTQKGKGGAAGIGKSVTDQLVLSVGRWFDVEGQFAAVPFHQDVVELVRGDKLKIS
ncbi:Signal peptidase complex subunit 2 [Quaeritorhiza haematococci]|nr:Signal peptidase complex subunit 2 [Quaeritorhiza haematococci]